MQLTEFLQKIQRKIFILIVQIKNSKMSEPRKRSKRRIGDVVKIDLGSDIASLGVVLNEPLIKFYAPTLQNELDIDSTLKSESIFTIMVMNSAIRSGRWPIVAKTNVDQELQETHKFFKQDQITKKLSIYEENGNEYPANYEACVGLECAMVWSAEHVEDRLRDFYMKRPCRWLSTIEK